jgi:DNA-binding CsgD family transcriptional regulator/tetratricopeptide (TPR) repeat protein
MLAVMVGRLSSPVFVGRGAELQTIATALDRAAAGETVHLLVGGEAGVGKTRFTAEAARLAGERGFRLLRGECFNVGGSGLPYGPLVEALRGLIGELDSAEIAAIAGPAAADLARLVPSFGSIEATAPAQSEWAQSRLFEALLGLLSRLGERSPILLAVEDLQWADPATLETIAFLVRGLRKVPALVIGTYRSDELHRRHRLLPWIAELERGGRVERVSLSRFERSELAELLTAILGVRAPSRVVDDVFRRSDGNPLFAEELLAAHEQGGSAPRLSPTLQEILLAHIARVPETAQPVLGVAAVAGRRVKHDLLAMVAGLPEDKLHDGLRAAVSGHLLVVETEGGQEWYAFRHALVQEAVYGELLPGERRSLHRAFAEALESEVPGSTTSEVGHWAELAYHWAAAREDRRAFEASLRASEAAIASFAFVAALEGYERAIELWDGLPDASVVAGFDRVELRRRAGDAAYLAADFRRAVAHRRDAVASADAKADPVRAGILREELGRALWVLGEPAAALEMYRDAVAIIPADPPSPERARVLSGLGQVLMLQARFDESLALCAEAIAIARAVGAPSAEGHALNTYGIDLVTTGDCARGIAALEESLRIGHEVRNADDIGRAYENLGEMLDDCGDTARAAAVAAEGIGVAEKLGIGLSYGYYIRLSTVGFSYALGRWDESWRVLEEAILRAPSGSGPEMFRLAQALVLQVGRGSFELADAGLARAVELIDEVPGAQFSAPIDAAAAERELWRHEPRAALERVEQGLERLAATDNRGGTAHLCRIGAWAAADLAVDARSVREEAVVSEARERLDRLRTRLKRVQESVTGTGLNIRLAADRATLEAEARRLDGIPDAKTWREVAAMWTHRERPYLVGYARWREAEAAAAAGDRATAIDALREAHAIAARLGARPLREALEWLGRRARIDPAPDDMTPEGPAPDVEVERLGLTPREREVLALVAEGRTNRQIAELLFISQNTAGVHVSNILGKLGVSSRVQAAATAFRLGLHAAEPADPGLNVELDR